MPDSHTCPACGAQNLDGTIDGIAAVCDSCGYAVEDFPAENPPTATHLPESATDDPETEATWEDIYTVSSSSEQQVAHALERLEAIADDLGWATSVRETAAGTIGQAAIDRVTDGRPIDVVVGAALYLAGKGEERPRPVERVARTVETDSQTLTHTSHVLQRELELPSPVCSATAYLPFLCGEREYGEGVERRAAALIETVEQTERVTGTSPPGLAAAALYEASDGAVTQRDLAYDAGITTETIRVRLHDLRQGCEPG